MSNLLELLSAVMSVDNQMRNVAETALTQMTESNASGTSLALLEIMASQNVSKNQYIYSIFMRILPQLLSLFYIFVGYFDSFLGWHFIA